MTHPENTSWNSILRNNYDFEKMEFHFKRNIFSKEKMEFHFNIFYSKIKVRQMTKDLGEVTRGGKNGSRREKIGIRQKGRQSTRIAPRPAARCFL